MGLNGIFVLAVISDAERRPPVAVKRIASSFSCRGINGSGEEGNIIHLIIVPPKMAPVDRRMVGIEISRSLLLVW